MSKASVVGIQKLLPQFWMLMALASSFGISVGPVHAQAKDILALEEVVVSARRVEEGLQSTPVAVTAVTSDEIKVRNMADIRDLAGSTPNMILQSSAANGGSQVAAIFLRGLGQFDVTLASDPAVGLYLDGVYIARNTGNILSLLELERVEVLRGPQGTLFGKNTIGGAINLISRKAGPEFELKAELTRGNFNMSGQKVSVNVPVTDNFFVQAVVAQSETDGYVDLVHYPGKNLGDSEKFAARLQAHWLPTDRVTIDGSLDYSLIEDVGSPTLLLEVYPDDVSPTLYNLALSGNPLCITSIGQETMPECYGQVHLSDDPYESKAGWTDRNDNKVDPYGDYEVSGANITAGWESPFGTFKSISAYRGLRTAFNFEGDRSPAMADGGDAKQQDADQFSQELQLFGRSFSDRLSWLGGLYYFKEDSLSRVEVYSPLALVVNGSYPLLTDNYQPQETITKSAFGQATWDFTDWLHLTVGLRWNREDKESLLILLPSTPDGLPGENHVEEWTPLVSVNVNFNEDVMAYLSYSEGFRSGGFPPRVIGQVDEIPSFGPEFAKTYEVGLKSEYLDRRVRTNIAVFRNEYTDIQSLAINDEVTPPLPTTINAGDALIEGTELEFEAILSESFRLDASASYMTTELTRLNPKANAGGLPVSRNTPLPYAPKWKASLGLLWNKQLSGIGYLVARADVSYRSSMSFFLADFPSSDLPELTTYSAGLTYISLDEHWEFSIGGKNLSDEYYFDAKGPKNSGANQQGTLAAPRTYFATVRWQY